MTNTTNSRNPIVARYDQSAAGVLNFFKNNQQKACFGKLSFVYLGIRKNKGYG